MSKSIYNNKNKNKKIPRKMLIGLCPHCPTSPFVNFKKEQIWQHCPFKGLLRYTCWTPRLLTGWRRSVVSSTRNLGSRTFTTSVWTETSWHVLNKTKSSMILPIQIVAYSYNFTMNLPIQEGAQFFGLNVFFVRYIFRGNKPWTFSVDSDLTETYSTLKSIGIFLI